MSADRKQNGVPQGPVTTRRVMHGGAASLLGLLLALGGCGDWAPNDGPAPAAPGVGGEAKSVKHAPPAPYVKALAEFNRAGGLMEQYKYSEATKAFEKVANLGTKAGVDGGLPFRVHAPLLQSTKAEIILRGAELGVPFQLTHSCYDPTPNGLACGLCDACILRRKGFHEAGVEDPTAYAG